MAEITQRLVAGRLDLGIGPVVTCVVDDDDLLQARLRHGSEVSWISRPIAGLVIRWDDNGDML